MKHEFSVIHERNFLHFFGFSRNKEEGYFIASELLRKICSSRKGIEAIRKSPPYLKRLHNHVEELTRKAHNEKRLDFYNMFFGLLVK